MSGVRRVNFQKTFENLPKSRKSENGNAERALANIENQSEVEIGVAVGKWEGEEVPSEQ